MTVVVEQNDCTALLALGAPPPSSFPRQLSWSDDGQLLIVTDVDINIMTFAHAYAVDRELIIDAAPALHPSKGKTRTRSLPLFRTRAAISKSIDIAWNEHSNDLSNTTTPSDNLRWRGVVWSPSGLNNLGGCFMAALTNRHQAVILGPKKNSHRDEWHKVFSISAALLRENISERIDDLFEVTPENNRRYENLIRAVTKSQTTAIAWSSALPTGIIDGSLLAVGTRAARITLWRHVAQGEMSKVSDSEASQSIIADLAWSPWRADGDGYTSILAFSSGDGQLSFCSVSRRSDATVSVGQPQTLVEGDSHIHHLTWIHRAEPPAALVLVAHRLGEVLLCSGWPHERRVTCLELPSLEPCDWDGASTWDPCCGIGSLPANDGCIVSLSCGLFYVVSRISVAPALDVAASTSLSIRMRGYFRMLGHEEGRPVTKERCMLTFAALSGPGSDDISWLYQDWEPYSLRSTARSVYNRSTFVTAGLTSPRRTQSAAEALTEVLKGVLSVIRMAPLQRLQPMLQVVNDAGTVMKALSDPAFIPLLSPSSIGPSAPSNLSQTSNLVERFERSLFINSTLNALRLRLVVCNVLQRLSGGASGGQAVESLVTEITRTITSAIGAAVAEVLQGANLDEKGQRLSYQIHASTADRSASSASTEACPACQHNIPFDDLRYGICENGHVWDRCSITMEIIQSLNIRTCTLCARKALTVEETKACEEQRADGADAMEVDRAASAELSPVDSLLKSSRVCLYCGGRWMHS